MVILFDACIFRLYLDIVFLNKEGQHEKQTTVICLPFSLNLSLSRLISLHKSLIQTP